MQKNPLCFLTTACASVLPSELPRNEKSPSLVSFFSCSTFQSVCAETRISGNQLSVFLYLQEIEIYVKLSEQKEKM